MKIIQVTIKGKLPKRELTIYNGGGKARCVTCESFLRGIGQHGTTDFLMEYEDGENDRA